MITLAELRAYLAEMTERANKYDVERNAESIAAHMWKRFTPEALSLWTTAGVLEHIASHLNEPADAEDDTEEEEE